MGPHGISASDLELRSAFESGRLPPADFGHRAHVQLAYVYLAESGTETAVQRMRDGLTAFLASHGLDAAKYHETLTRAWVLAVAHFMERTPGTSSADDFIARNPVLLDSRIMQSHYSAETLFSPEARARFVEPDLAPIPRHD